MIIMKHYNAYNSISQMPVVLIPIEFDRQSHINDQESTTNRLHWHSIVLRTFLTKDFMTGRPALPGETFPIEMLDEMRQTIITNVPGISRVLYDLTSKPPGIDYIPSKTDLNFSFLATTEWE
jgi:GMP synthase (glutamine-hydrolysing)